MTCEAPTGERRTAWWEIGIPRKPEQGGKAGQCPKASALSSALSLCIPHIPHCLKTLKTKHKDGRGGLPSTNSRGKKKSVTWPFPQFQTSKGGLQSLACGHLSLESTSSLQFLLCPHVSLSLLPATLLSPASVLSPAVPKLTHVSFPLEDRLWLVNLACPS